MRPSLTRFPHLSVAVADLAVAQEAAAPRVSHGFRARDALIIASRLLNQVSHLVTLMIRTRLSVLSQWLSAFVSAT